MGSDMLIDGSTMFENNNAHIDGGEERQNEYVSTEPSTGMGYVLIILCRGEVVGSQFLNELYVGFIYLC